MFMKQLLARMSFCCSGSHHPLLACFPRDQMHLELAILLGHSQFMRLYPSLNAQISFLSACRSACYFQQKNYHDCLTDIDLALEAGYATQIVYKLYIRQCKCLLELNRIQEAQEAFDKAIDAIDRSGLKKNLRKDMTADLQSAFINLAKSVAEDPPPEPTLHSKVSAERKLTRPL